MFPVVSERMVSEI